MQLKYAKFFCLLLILVSSLYGEEGFIAKRQQLKPYYGYRNILMIASPGRSGSTLLTNVTKKYATRYKVLKTHLLPPNTRYKGKILFIFSHPDQAAESALHLVLNSKSHGATHFSNVETADRAWFNKIGRNASNQNEIDNLLAYDALGCTEQLKEWLHRRTQPSGRQEAQILAIKYEHLWDIETVQAIKDFLGLDAFKLPPKRERGCDLEKLSSQEIHFRRLYNVGTEEEPLYHAYDQARELWQQAPPFQFLKILP
jgi:hypothetical protein